MSRVGSLAASDPYRVLGLTPDATDDDVKRAYRRLMRELHPDVSGDQASTARAAALNEAYAVLSEKPSEFRRFDDVADPGTTGAARRAADRTTSTARTRRRRYGVTTSPTLRLPALRLRARPRPRPRPRP
jgi:curved DNA-binding protein CbpA